MVQLPSLVALSVAAGVAIASPIAEIQSRQNIGGAVDLFVTGVRYNGEGCPAGSLTGTLQKNGQFDVVYKNFHASIKPHEPKVKVKCHIEVDVQTSTDTQLAVLSGTYLGHVRLTKGAWAKNENQYKFVGNPGAADMEWVFKGPKDVSTEFTNVLNDTFVSGCHSNGGAYTLIINNYLTMTTEGTGEGEISVTEIADAGLKQSIKLATVGCN